MVDNKRNPQKRAQQPDKQQQNADKPKGKNLHPDSQSTGKQNSGNQTTGKARKAQNQRQKSHQEPNAAPTPAASNVTPKTAPEQLISEYRLEQQAGFLLREVWQRHGSIFARQIGADLTPTRFAVLAKLYEKGRLTQNELGRQTAMDAATIKGVVDKLAGLSLVRLEADDADRRRRYVVLTERGHHTAEQAIPCGIRITDETLSPLTATEREQFLRLLVKMR